MRRFEATCVNAPVHGPVLLILKVQEPLGFEATVSNALSLHGAINSSIFH